MNELTHVVLCERIQQLKDHREELLTTALRAGLNVDAQCDSISDLICALYAQCDVLNGCE